MPFPWPFPQRGRPPKFSPRRHAAICVTVVSLNLSYRQFEGASPLVLGKTIDHSTIGWAFKRLAPSYVRLLLRFLARRIEPLLQPEFFVMDSTGISTNFYSRKRGVLRWGRKKVFLKLHALVGCSLQKGALFVREASVTGEGCHDLTQVAYLLEAAEGGGRPLLADSAYDYTLAYRLARERGFRPVKTQGNGGTQGVREEGDGWKLRPGTLQAEEGCRGFLWSDRNQVPFKDKVQAPPRSGMLHSPYGRGAKPEGPSEADG